SYLLQQCYSHSDPHSFPTRRSSDLRYYRDTAGREIGKDNPIMLISLLCIKDGRRNPKFITEVNRTGKICIPAMIFVSYDKSAILVVRHRRSKRISFAARLKCYVIMLVNATVVKMS